MVALLQDDVPTSYYAVFDGHAGTDAAFYAASQLHEKLVRNRHFASDPSQALREAFLETDHAFVTEHENEVRASLNRASAARRNHRVPFPFAEIERRHDGRGEPHPRQLIAHRLAGRLPGGPRPRRRRHPARRPAQARQKRNDTLPYSHSIPVA